MQDELNRLLAQSKDDLAAVKTATDLESLLFTYLGRKGRLAELAKKIKTVPESERKAIGVLLNQVKQELTRNFKSKSALFFSAKATVEQVVDFTLPGTGRVLGGVHPLTQFQDRIIDIFNKLGFEVVVGNEVETERYNFDLLNVPKDHPARDVQDTFYLGENNKWVLRTHTSNVQLRAMRDRQPPVKIISPGRCYRNEATDASHEATFYQFECFVVDEGVNMGHLIQTLKVFLTALYGDVKIRLRPSYFPFVEPGMEIDISCLLCQQKGCSVCKQTGWLEILGAGMIHPVVLKNMGVNPKKYSGFAFGSGIDRLLMLYYGLNDIRLEFSGDLRFLKQF